MKLPAALARNWAFYLTVVFLYAASFLRTLLIYRSRSEISWLAAGLLLAWLALYLGQPALTRRWAPAFWINIAAQAGLTVALLTLPVYPDYFAVLLACTSMQIMQRCALRTGVIVVALFTPLTIVLIIPSVGLGQAIALAVLYTSVNALLGSYAWTARQVEETQAKNLALMNELEENNRQLQAYSAQVEQLAVARERNTLARELHDSVTQSLFSMTLATQAALLLVDRDPTRLGANLERLNQLAQAALAELRELISELGRQAEPELSLEAAIRHHLQSGALPETLAVSLESEGSGALTPAESKSLFRIVQEALNNVVKHAQAGHVSIRLRLEAPSQVEITDDGRGFVLQKTGAAGHIGLGSMRERAAEIGWEFEVQSAPGAGTQVRVQKPSEGERP